MAVESACLEIRESVAWDSIAHVTNGAGVLFYRRVCSSLVEDNIIYRCFPGVEISSGSGGNVIAYNFMEDNYTDQSRLMGASFDCNHGAHTCMDLYEGNVGSMFQSDGYFGSASHITLFRNRFHGTNPTLTDNSKCVDLGRWSQYFNVVGNVLGTAGFSVLLDPTETFPYAKPVIYRLGFPNMGNNGFEGTRPPSTANDALDTRVRGHTDSARELRLRDKINRVGGRHKRPGTAHIALFEQQAGVVWQSGLASDWFRFKSDGRANPSASAIQRDSFPVWRVAPLSGSCSKGSSYEVK